MRTTTTQHSLASTCMHGLLQCTQVSGEQLVTPLKALAVRYFSHFIPIALCLCLHQSLLYFSGYLHFHKPLLFKMSFSNCRCNSGVAVYSEQEGRLSVGVSTRHYDIIKSSTIRRRRLRWTVRQPID